MDIQRHSLKKEEGMMFEQKQDNPQFRKEAEQDVMMSPSEVCETFAPYEGEGRSGRSEVYNLTFQKVEDNEVLGGANNQSMSTTHGDDVSEFQIGVVSSENLVSGTYREHELTQG
jgi:hypothetical protein